MFQHSKYYCDAMLHALCCCSPTPSLLLHNAHNALMPLVRVHEQSFNCLCSVRFQLQLQTKAKWSQIVKRLNNNSVDMYACAHSRLGTTANIIHTRMEKLRFSEHFLIVRKCRFLVCGISMEAFRIAVFRVCVCALNPVFNDEVSVHGSISKTVGRSGLKMWTPMSENLTSSNAWK